MKAAFKGLPKDKCRPACIIVEASGRVVVAHTGKTRAAVSVDGSFTFVTPPREEGELSSGGDHRVEVDVLGANRTWLCGNQVQAPFNSWSLAVGARCCSLDTVECIRGTSCPGLGRKT